MTDKHPEEEKWWHRKSLWHGTTHYDDCHEAHHHCALMRVEALEADLAKALDLADLIVVDHDLEEQMAKVVAEWDQCKADLEQVTEERDLLEPVVRRLSLESSVRAGVEQLSRDTMNQLRVLRTQAKPDA